MASLCKPCMLQLYADRHFWKDRSNWCPPPPPPPPRTPHACHKVVMVFLKGFYCALSMYCRIYWIFVCVSDHTINMNRVKLLFLRRVSCDCHSLSVFFFPCLYTVWWTPRNGCVEYRRKFSMKEPSYLRYAVNSISHNYTIGMHFD